MTELLLRSEKIARVSLATKKLREKMEARAYECSLIEFAEYMWPVVEPSIKFVRGWALDAIAEHLQAVSRGEIRRLLINVPPGFSKSLLTDVFWPAWEWGPQNHPSYRYVCASYANYLTERDNMRCRNIVMSDRYQKFWGNRFRISSEQFTKVKFANDQTGWKLATSTGGIGVGERGDRFIIDDPNNTMLMESEAIRANTNMWFTEVVPDRLNSPEHSAIVLIQQRLHEEDVSGVAMDREFGYVELIIPMTYVPHGFVSGYDLDGKIKTFDTWDVTGPQPQSIFWQDPRTEDGELAWPERFPAHTCEELQHAKGNYAWAGQYQQTPEVRGGSIIRREYWNPWEDAKYPDNIEYILASVDTAYTEKEVNDPSAMTVWGLFRDINGNRRFLLLHAWEERLEIHKLVQRIIDTCTRDNRETPSPARFAVDRLLIEAKASGLSVSQEIRRIVGFNGQFGIELINPTKQGDKVARAHSVLHMFSDGMIYAPNRMWSDKVINQCAVFPHGTHDDLVDSTTMALRYLRDTGLALRREEDKFDEDEELRYRPKLPALYPV